MQGTSLKMLILAPHHALLDPLMLVGKTIPSRIAGITKSEKISDQHFLSMEGRGKLFDLSLQLLTKI